MNEITKYVESIYRFCIKRLSNRQDAEDLASEIIVHVLSGLKKYQIESLESWIWRIAHNRYARFIENRNKRSEAVQTNADIQDDYDFIDELIITDEYRQVFKYLHTLTSEYRNILVDYYIGGLPIKHIAKNYSLTETTVKWRLNTSRNKIKTRIGANKMDKIYKPVNWNTNTCNGNMNPNKYLQSQLARAICKAAYEKPLTVEEISLATGIPTLYIEDELPRLIHGEAISKEGSKYATNFIVLRQQDKKVMETKFALLVNGIADQFVSLFTTHEPDIAKLGFYSADFSMRRLGYIAIPAVLRQQISKIKEELNMHVGPYPPRKDGGYGWFIVEETEDEKTSPTDSGCNTMGKDRDFIYYYHIGKYFDGRLCNVSSQRWFSESGKVNEGILGEDELIALLETGLIAKDGSGYKINFACFSPTQFADFKKILSPTDAQHGKLLKTLITDIHKSFKSFVPKRLDSQINQWVACYVRNIIGLVIEELITRGVLETPDADMPLSYGMFSILGQQVDV